MVPVVVLVVSPDSGPYQFLAEGLSGYATVEHLRRMTTALREVILLEPAVVVLSLTAPHTADGIKLHHALKRDSRTRHVWVVGIHGYSAKTWVRALHVIKRVLATRPYGDVSDETNRFVAGRRH